MARAHHEQIGGLVIGFKTLALARHSHPLINAEVANLRFESAAQLAFANDDQTIGIALFHRRIGFEQQRVVLLRLEVANCENPPAARSIPHLVRRRDGPRIDIFPDFDRVGNRPKAGRGNAGQRREIIDDAFRAAHHPRGKRQLEPKRRLHHERRVAACVDVLRAEAVLVHRDDLGAATRKFRDERRGQRQGPDIRVSGDGLHLPEIAQQRRGCISEAWRVKVDDSRRPGDRREQRAPRLEQYHINREALRNQLLRQRNRNSLRPADLQVRQDDGDAACHSLIVSAFLDLNREDLWHPACAIARRRS